MTIRPVPASVPWLSMRTRLVRVPGLSEGYQDRICFTRSLKAIGGLPHLGSLQKRMARLAETAGGSTAGHNLRAEVLPKPEFGSTTFSGQVPIGWPATRTATRKSPAQRQGTASQSTT